MDIAKGLRTPDSQIGFLLLCGYFKATKRFYQPQNFRDRDIAAAIHQLNFPDSTFDPAQYTETTRLRHQRQATSHPALLAGVMGLGCGIGVRKMARISYSVTESELDHTVNWRFSLENIRAANDAVIKAMDGMELPNLYRQPRDQLHTASDGQKFEVRGDSLHASRSFKYFGQGQGVSAYTGQAVCPSMA